MSTLISLILLVAVFGAGYVSDTNMRTHPALRWAYTGRNYIIQRRSILGAWIPVGKKTFPDSQKAEEAIASMIKAITEENEGKFGPIVEAPKSEPVKESE